MTFTEFNTVEQMILDAVTKHGGVGTLTLGDEVLPGASLGSELRPTPWDYVPATDIPRQFGDVMVESWVREALIRLNPEIKAQPDRADHR